MASISVSVIRGLFGMAEHVAPRLAGRAAFEIFCRTPNPSRLSNRQRQAIEAAAPLMAQARRHCLAGGDRQRFVAHEFQPSIAMKNEPKALLIHGWHSRAEHMGGLIEALRGSGFNVIAIDLPGHGRSPGRRLNMALAVAAVQAVAAEFGPFDAMVGHSFGGAVAVNAAAGSIGGIAPVGVGRLALVSAPSSLPALFDDFGGFLGLGPRSRAALDDEVQRVAGRRLEAFVGARQLAELSIPTLVVHAPDDKEVPAHEAEAFARAGAHVQLFWAPGLGHRRILADRQVIARLAGFAAGERYLVAI